MMNAGPAGMKVNTRLLRSHPLLSLVPGGVLRSLVSESAVREYPKGTVIFREGTPCDAIYLVVSGRCESRTGANRDDSRVEEVFGPGDTFGERELLNQEPYRSTISVLTDSVLLRIAGAHLQMLFEQKPSLAGRYFRRVSERFRALRDGREKWAIGARRVVAMMALSPRLHERGIAQRLAAALHGLAGQRVLLVHFLPGIVAPALRDWPSVEERLDDSFSFSGWLHEHERGFHELHFHVSDERGESSFVAPLVSHLGRHFDYVLLQVHPKIATSSAIECIRQCDLSFIWLEPTIQNLYDYKLLMSALAGANGSSLAHVRPVVCVGDCGVPAEFSRSLNELGHPVHSFVRGVPIDGASGFIDRAGNFALHTNRLAREIGRCRIGLALSSGGAKGLAHIGVIQVLEELGVEVDMIAGSSMGAYVASVWAFGHDGQACEKIARELETRWGLVHLAHPVFPPRQGFLRTGRAIRRLRRSIGDSEFWQLMRPLRVVGTYLDTLERVVFSSGEVATAVEASIAIPGICVPVIIDGVRFIDGGIADPLPVDVLREVGIERVIAVNTIPTPERLRQALDMEKELKRPDEHREFSIGGVLNRHLNYFARGNVLDTMLRAIHGVQTRVAEDSCRRADVVLRPWACDSRWHDFTNPRKYIALGRQVAENSATELKALVPQKANEPNSQKLATASP
jgi:NTE family protein